MDVRELTNIHVSNDVTWQKCIKQTVNDIFIYSIV